MLFWKCKYWLRAEYTNKLPLVVGSMIDSCRDCRGFDSHLRLCYTTPNLKSKLLSSRNNYILTKKKTMCHRLTFRTIDKSYTNNYIDKCIELVPIKLTTTIGKWHQSMRENGMDKYRTHKQKCSREKARIQTFC